MTTLMKFVNPLTALIFFLVLAASVVSAQTDPALQYQDRGDRFEGVKPDLIASGSIALLAAQVDVPKSSTWPESMRLRFYLPKASKAHVVVRELMPIKERYWLDKIRPTARSAAFHEISWPTATVLKKLTRLTLENLGAVVRLGTAEAKRTERVAPAILGDEVSGRVPGYCFTFRTDAPAQLEITIRRDADKKVVFRRQKSREMAGLPFTVCFKAKEQPDGWYRLILDGFFEGDGKPLRQEVVFYHRAELPAETAR